LRIEITDYRSTDLAMYARIPISLEVNRVLGVVPLQGGLGGFAFSERQLDQSFVKDYDVIESPLKWPESFDMTNWAFFIAYSNGVPVGGATVAVDTSELVMLESRRDLALLWDIRVSPNKRRRGVGTKLFQAAEEWAKTKGCRQLKVETQNVNVPACRFYSKQGCLLGAVHRFAYPEFPDEVQLLWYKDLVL
jgi:GNAT superfamily N-acetyltransferase